MDFARKILGKYGWKDGDGLGKNSDGIAKPLRATLKFDNAGFGANQAESDFNNHWWERVFNDAAKNVEVNQSGGTVKMDLKSQEDSVEISTRNYSVKKLKKAKESRGNKSEADDGYDNFMKASTLTSLGSEVENPDRIETNDIEVTKVKVLTDEELFKACGGRTAHKGARHGLKLSGKLLRLEQQEQELLAQMMAKRNVGKEHKTVEKELKTKKNKQCNVEDQYKTEDVFESNSISKKKKKKRKHETDNDDPYTTSQVPEDECQSKESKKKKKKRDAEGDKCLPIGDNHTNDENVSRSSDNENQADLETIVKKKKKKKHKDANLSETPTVEEIGKPTKTKKETTDSVDNEVSSVVVENNKTKKKKLKKLKSERE